MADTVSMPSRGRACTERDTALLDQCLRVWSLQLDGRMIAGNNALVQPVRRADGSLAMLRIGGPSSVTAAAWRVLQLWDGDGAVKLFAHDADQDVILLERLDRTRDLDSVPIGDAVVIAGQLRNRLERPAIVGIRSLEDLAERWSTEIAAASNLSAALKDQAGGWCRELCPGANRHLVNADLHYRNVLGAQREPWLVIDPLPLAGDREFGLSSLLWGRLEDTNTDRVLSALIEVCDLDRDRAVGWTIVETTVKLLTATGRVARNCRTIIHDLTSSGP